MLPAESRGPLSALVAHLPVILLFWDGGVAGGVARWSCPTWHLSSESQILILGVIFLRL